MAKKKEPMSAFMKALLGLNTKTNKKRGENYTIVGYTKTGKPIYKKKRRSK